ncbi:MAG: PAS domain S-box protein, partial [bacterium]|nr:PAS domain S-box protein [bacterium]
LVIAALTFRIDGLDRERDRERETAIVKEGLQVVATEIEAAIMSRALLMRPLDALVATNPEVTPERFQTFAAQVLSRHRQSGVRSLQLARGSVVSHLYPLQGNEQALGHDLLNDPARGPAVRAAISAEGFVLEGPYRLRQGGRGVVIRAPIFLVGEEAPDAVKDYWGLAIVVLDFSLVLDGLGFDTCDCALRMEAGIGSDDSILRGRENVFDSDGVRITIPLPGATWELAAPPPSEELTATLFSPIRLTGGMASLFLTALTWFGVTRRQRLAAAVEEAAGGLMRSERRQRALMEAAPAGIYEADADGRCNYANPGWCELAGLRQEQVLGDVWFHMAHPDDQESITHWWGQLLQQDASSPLEYRFLKSDGSSTWVVGTAEVTRGLDGELLFVTGAVLDITARKRAEDERRELENRVLHSQKLESLGVLAGGIAHDFNNLLVAVLGHAGLALESLPAEASARHDLEEVELAAKRAADLCQQMLAYAGRGKFKVGPVALNGLISEITELLGVSVSKEVNVRFDLSEDIEIIEADGTQLRQVLMNLIINAAEAMPEGGVVEIRTRSRQCGAEDLAEARFGAELTPGRYVLLEVVDHGQGIDEGNLQRVFEPFYTTKFAGRGLGMSAVLGIVQRHAAAIQVETAIGSGTAFTVFFPASANRDLEVSVRVRPSDTWKCEGTILVVDDEDSVRRLAARILERLGFQVIQASSGVEAVEFFVERSDQIVAVILDLTMPGMGGEECFVELRRIRNDVRVLLVSGYSESDAIGRFVDGQIAGFLQKPYGPQTLTDGLRAILG